MPSPHERELKKSAENFISGASTVTYPDREQAVGEGHYLDPESYLLEDWESIYKFTLSDMRRFPRFLSEMLLKTDPTRLSVDHSMFWGWTAAYISQHPIRNRDGYEDLIIDFLRMVHFMLFKHRQIHITNSYQDYVRFGDGPMATTLSESWRNVSWMNPSIDPISMLSDRYASTAGFSVLDGLLIQHCEKLNNNGHIDGDTVHSPWRHKKDKIGGNINFHDRMQIWAYYEATDEVQLTLTEVDDLSDYDIGVLCRNIPGIEKRVEDEMRTTQHFLRAVSKLRNANIHGLRASRVIGSLVVTLCCLLLWDEVSLDDYQSRKSQIQTTISNAEMFASENGFSPTAFYPVDRYRSHVGGTQVPSDPAHPQHSRSIQNDE